MNLELFIAKKIHFSQKEGKRTSLPAIKIAITGIALGLAVMILSLAIIIGFKKEIRNKVIGFGSNIQITNFDRNSSFETEPIAINDSLLAMIKQFPGVRHISPFSTKPGILKTETDFQGIVLKGVDQTYDWTFFRDNLKEGELPSFDGKRASTDILMSQHMANLLKLKVGDSFLTYFVQDNVKARKFHITGIYDTGFVDYDKLFVITDIRQITSLNDWEKDEVSGYEIMIDKFDNLDLVTEGLDEALDEETDKSGNSYYVRSIKELNPEIFAWLDVLDINVVVIIILMLDFRTTYHHLGANKHDWHSESLGRKQRQHPEDIPLCVVLPHQQRHVVGKHHRDCTMSFAIPVQHCIPRSRNVLSELGAYRLEYHGLAVAQYRNVNRLHVHDARPLLPDYKNSTSQKHPLRIVTTDRRNMRLAICGNCTGKPSPPRKHPQNATL